MPDRLVSVSGCLAKFLPDTWCIEWANASNAERIDAAEFFCLDEDKLRLIVAKATQMFGERIGWPNVCRDLEAAQSFAAETKGPEIDLRILELGLHVDSVEAFCRDAEPNPSPDGYAPMGRHGVHELLLFRNFVSESGARLGFEPLLSDGTITCSWLCNGLESVVAERLDIRPNSVGLIETLDQALEAVALIGHDDTGAEPGRWLPWLVVDHTGQN
ncbi:MAG: hypothetical protein WBD31_27195 [Rubripirellula sp.]